MRATEGRARSEMMVVSSEKGPVPDHFRVAKTQELHFAPLQTRSRLGFSALAATHPIYIKPMVVAILLSSQEYLCSCFERRVLTYLRQMSCIPIAESLICPDRTCL